LVDASDGETAVVIDGGSSLKLPSALIELVAILKSEEGKSPDELVPWKSLDRICEFLHKKLGREFNHHTVSQLLLRLRGLLTNDRWLIESSRKKGARFRLKLKACSACFGC